MKSLYRILYVLSVAFFAMAGCTDPVEEETVSIHLNKELITSLPVGSEQILTATVKPEGAAVTVVWSSDNEEVAVVNDEGVVTGVAPGNAVITAKAGKATATCKVTVTAVKPEKIELNPKNLELEIGAEHTLEVMLTPENAVADDITWSTNNDKVATVKDGVVKAVAVGSATITVKCNGGGCAAVCQVSVVKEKGEPVPDKVLVSEIKMTSVMNLEVGHESVLSVTVLPENATDKTVSFTTDGDCIEVDEKGKVRALKMGTAKVTATAADGSGVKAECAVTVAEPVDEKDKLISVSIVVGEGVTDIQVGMPLQLELVCNPDTAKPKSVSWTTDNETFATVDQNGVVTATYAEKGDDDWVSTVVSVNADGLTANLKLRVIPRQPDAIVFDVPGRALKVGESWNVNARITPEDAGLPFTYFHTGGLLVRDGVFMSGEPGHFDVYYAISEHDNLVYERRATFSVDVHPYWVESVSLPATQELELGSTLAMIPTFTSDAEGVEPTYRTVKWTSSAPSVVSVDENTGEMTAKAEGSAEITVTTTDDWAVPAGTSHKSATCLVTVKQSESSLNVGDYYYSDGTWSSTLESGKTVIGVVYAKVNATSSDPLLAKDYPGCTHGLVVSLSEYTDQDFGSVSTYYGHGYYKDLGYNPNMIVDIEKPNGFGNTLAHGDLNASKSDYCLFFNKTDGVVVKHAGTVAAPASASSWYVPSFKEMSYLVENSEAVNAALVAAGGTAIAAPYESEVSWDDNRSSDWYWTSTIFGSWYANGGTYDHYKYPFDISKGGWTTYVQSSANCKVRVVLAF